MPRTRDQLEQAARDAEAWLDSIDPADVKVNPSDDLRAIATALDSIASAEGDLEAAVRAARARGRSWGVIAMALGVSRQSARERFAEVGA